MPDWYEIENADEVASPALLIYPPRIEQNIQHMLEVAGGAERLRPHVKTHKMPQIVQMQRAVGIEQFKCATIAEAEMLAECSAADVLWAYQPVGPNIKRLRRLIERFPKTRFSALVDAVGSVELLEQASVPVGLFVDVDCGMHRSGIATDERAEALYRRIVDSPVVQAAGLHAYDGHIKEGTSETREQAVDASFAAVTRLRERLESQGLQVPSVVAGGSPTFFFHAEDRDRQNSPGTTVLWDGSYSTKFPEMGFLHAAMLLTRVISCPAADLLCLDLGYKAVSPDNARPRVLFPQLPDAEMVVHSEEHLTIRSQQAERFGLGDCLYGVPWHVCPTVALYPAAQVVRDARVQESWPIVARDRTLTI